VAPRGVDEEALTAIGFPVFGPRPVRADVIVRMLARVQIVNHDEAEIASWLGAPRKDVQRILRGAITSIGSRSARCNH
jgi:hypothetical protein